MIKKILITALSVLSLMMPNVLMATTDGKTTVILLSDIPYDGKQEQILKNKIIPAIKAKKNDFIVHLGDFLAGSSFHSCTDDNIINARDYIYGLNPNKVFFTPGDNDWTDCDRKSKEQRFSEYERLSFLRRVFYQPTPIYPSELGVMQDKKYPENMIWRVHNVVYTTLHIVGTNNGRDKILLDEQQKALNKVDARDKANIKWLKKAQHYAVDQKADALIIFSQADITNIKKQFLGLMDNLPVAFKTRLIVMVFIFTVKSCMILRNNLKNLYFISMVIQVIIVLIKILAVIMHRIFGV